MLRILAILSLIFLLLYAGLSFASEPLFGEGKTYDRVLVKKVISANTFVLANEETIQLIGLTVPEPPKRKKVQRDEHGFIIEEKDPTTSLEEQAFEFVKNLVEGKYLRLEFDAEKKSADFKTLAYAFLEDNSFLNAQILKEGFANLKIMPPNTKYAEQLREAYQEARQEKRGLQSE